MLSGKKLEPTSLCENTAPNKKKKKYKIESRHLV